MIGEATSLVEILKFNLKTQKSPQKSLVCDGTRTSLPAKPSPNPDDAGTIVRRPWVSRLRPAATEPGLTDLKWHS